MDSQISDLAEEAEDPSLVNEDSYVREVKDKLSRGDYEKRRPANLRSPMWAQFSKIFDKSSGEYLPLIICNTCGKLHKFNSKHGTTNMKRHVCSTSDSGETSKKAKFSPPMELRKRVTQSMVKFCCADLRPFNVLKGPGFREVVSTLLTIGAKLGSTNVKNLDIDALLPDPTTISANVANAHGNEIQKLLDVVHPHIKEKAVSATTDMWVEKYRQRTFLGITVHFLDQYWKLHNRLLFAKEFPSSDSNREEYKKTGENVLEVMVDKFSTYDVTIEDLRSIHFITDKGSNMIKALEDFPRSNCVAHILNTVLQSVFSAKTFSKHYELIAKCLRKAKALVEYFKRSAHCDMLSSSLCQQCKTRWNTMVMMVQSVLKVYDEIQSILQARHDERRLEGVSIAKLAALVELLQPFRTATEILEKASEPTSAYVILQVESVKHHLAQMINKYSAAKPCADSSTETVANSVADSVTGSVADSVEGSSLGSIADSIVDSDAHLVGDSDAESIEFNDSDSDAAEPHCIPWHKEMLGIAKELLKAVEEKCVYTEIHKVALFLWPRYRQVRCLPNPTAELVTIQTYIEDWFTMPAVPEEGASLPESSFHSSIPSSPNPSYTDSHNICINMCDQWEDVPLNNINSTIDTIRLEISHYTRAAYHNEPILHWWRTNCSAFPNLSRLARHIFSIPATSAPCEREWSVAGRVVENRRTLLTEDNIDGIMFVHSLYTKTS